LLSHEAFGVVRFETLNCEHLLPTYSASQSGERKQERDFEFSNHYNEKLAVGYRQPMRMEAKYKAMQV
jgi:hypothetical protein